MKLADVLKQLYEYHAYIGLCHLPGSRFSPARKCIALALSVACFVFGAFILQLLIGLRSQFNRAQTETYKTVFLLLQITTIDSALFSASVNWWRSVTSMPRHLERMLANVALVDGMMACDGGANVSPQRVRRLHAILAIVVLANIIMGYVIDYHTWHTYLIFTIKACSDLAMIRFWVESWIAVHVLETANRAIMARSFDLDLITDVTQLVYENIRISKGLVIVPIIFSTIEGIALITMIVCHVTLNYEQIMKNLSSIVWMIYHVIILIKTAHACECIEHALQDSKNIIFKISTDFNDYKARQGVNRLRFLVHSSEESTSPGKNFFMGYSYLCTFLGIVTSYTVILYQMKTS